MYIYVQSNPAEFGRVLKQAQTLSFGLTSVCMKHVNTSTVDVLYLLDTRTGATIEFVIFQEKEVNGIKFWCYHAGHVLGAAMFMIEIAGVKVHQ